MEFDDLDDVEEEIDEEQQQHAEVQSHAPPPRVDHPQTQSRRRSIRESVVKKSSNDRDDMIATFQGILQKQERERMRERAEEMYERMLGRRSDRREGSLKRRSTRRDRDFGFHNDDDYASDYSGDEGGAYEDDVDFKEMLDTLQNTIHEDRKKHCIEMIDKELKLDSLFEDDGTSPLGERGKTEV